MIAQPKEPIQVLQLNLDTVIRNAYQAYETDDRAQVRAEGLANDVLQDLKGIYDNLALIGTAGIPELVVYRGSYKGLANRFKRASLWQPTTELQKAYATLAHATANGVVKAMKGLVKDVDYTVPRSTKRTYVVTHHVVDLLTPMGYGTLYLIESHTGVVKGKGALNTKLTNGASLARMPFNALTLQVFGDNSTNFRSGAFRYKAALLKLAEDHKWTPGATVERVHLGLTGLKDPELKKELLEMLSV